MTELDRKGQDPVSVPFTPGMRDNPDELAAIPDEIARELRGPRTTRRTTEEFAARVAQRVVQLLLLGPQVLPRGLPGHAGDPQRVVDADRLPRQRRGDGPGRADHRGRRRRLRQLHPVRRLRAALPQHAVHRRLLPVPHPHGRRRQGGPRAGRRERRAPAAVADLERAHRRAAPTSRCSARPRSARSTCATGPTGSTSRSAARPCCSSTARRRSTARRCRARWPRSCSMAGVRVRADGRAVVLRRARRRDGVRRPGEAVRPAQPRQLALDRHQAGARPRPARLHLVHRGLPEVLRRRLRHRGRAGRRAVRRADPRGPAHAVGADRADDHLPRPLSAQQAQGHLEGAARDPARDPRAWTSTTSTG